MDDESIWVVQNLKRGDRSIVAVGSKEKITEYLNSIRSVFSYYDFLVCEFKNVNFCTTAIWGSDYTNWDNFLNEVANQKRKRQDVNI